MCEWCRDVWCLSSTVISSMVTVHSGMRGDCQCSLVRDNKYVAPDFFKDVMEQLKQLR